MSTPKISKCETLVERMACSKSGIHPVPVHRSRILRRRLGRVLEAPGGIAVEALPSFSSSRSSIKPAI